MSGQAWPRLTNSPLAYKKQNYSVLTLNLGHNLITRILTATVLYKKILLVHFSQILIYFFFKNDEKLSFEPFWVLLTDVKQAWIFPKICLSIFSIQSPLISQKSGKPNMTIQPEIAGRWTDRQPNRWNDSIGPLCFKRVQEEIWFVLLNLVWTFRISYQQFLSPYFDLIWDKQRLDLAWKS